jgi:hypothetical protein
MSFAVTHHYLIEPKPNLIARAQAMLEASFAELFLQRLIVAKQHQSSINSGLERANLSALRIGFLARTQFDWTWDFPAQFAELLGSSELTTALFDQWWQCSDNQENLGI